MKNLFLSLAILFLLAACGQTQEPAAPSDPPAPLPPPPPSETVRPEIQSIMDSAKVKGSVLIYDVDEDAYLSNDFTWARSGHLPASTFKIPNSIIGLETGVIEGEETIFPWDGEPKRIRSWEQDLALPKAFQYSCLPCYRQVARDIGLERMQIYLEKLAYPGMDVNAENLDIFWVDGESRITQFQQIDFLRQIYANQLPISAKTQNIITKILVIEDHERFKLSGKTGWSVDGELNNGWFIGYIETGEKMYYYATNVEPGAGFNMDDFGRVRRHVTMKSMLALGLIQ